MELVGVSAAYAVIRHACLPDPWRVSKRRIHSPLDGIEHQGLIVLLAMVVAGVAGALVGGQDFGLGSRPIHPVSALN